MKNWRVIIMTHYRLKGLNYDCHLSFSSLTQLHEYVKWIKENEQNDFQFIITKEIF